MLGVFLGIAVNISLVYRVMVIVSGCNVILLKSMNYDTMRRNLAELDKAWGINKPHKLRFFPFGLCG